MDFGHLFTTTALGHGSSGTELIEGSRSHGIPIKGLFIARYGVAQPPPPIRAVSRPSESAKALLLVRLYRFGL